MFYGGLITLINFGHLIIKPNPDTVINGDANLTDGKARMEYYNLRVFGIVLRLDVFMS